MRRALFLASLAITLGGCSTADTYINRPTTYDSLPQGLKLGYAPQLATLSLDSNRRLMITRLGPNPISCSEPPPDSAASILAKDSAQADIKTPGTTLSGAQLSDEFHSDAALIAKRTAEVEFWRTTSFEYCQLLMNGMTDNAIRYLQTAEKIAPDFMGSDQDQSSNKQQGQGDPQPQPPPAGAIVTPIKPVQHTVPVTPTPKPKPAGIKEK